MLMDWTRAFPEKAPWPAEPRLLRTQLCAMPVSAPARSTPAPKTCCDGSKVIYHSGRINGFSSYMAYYPDEKLAVIALSNVSNGKMATIVNELANIASKR